jgi:hypothetical protein
MNDWIILAGDKTTLKFPVDNDLDNTHGKT